MDELRAIVSEAIATEANFDLNSCHASPLLSAAPCNSDSKPLTESGSDLETDPAASASDDLLVVHPPTDSHL